MYDQREKAQRYYEWTISGAREERREEGREEGKLAGKIQILQELLGELPTTDAELKSKDIAVLTTQLATLQQRLRDRQAYLTLGASTTTAITTTTVRIGLCFKDSLEFVDRRDIFKSHFAIDSVDPFGNTPIRHI